ncbi:hypothetical protein [Micromonospora noduli]|uniref:hypothetical protein n=1 Tax=Micromonospora noduli TaxID=709876 RepID=UPI0011BFBBCE|nr:hypothetical protein [Micromonospora noduli]
MSAFWAGVVSSLVGAVIGGAFTAFGAWLQGRSAFRTAIAQVDLAHERQVAFARNQASYDALNQLSRLIYKAGRAFDEASRIHSDYHDQRNVRFLDDETLGMRLAAKEVEEAISVHETHYPSVVIKALDKGIVFYGLHTHRGWKEFLTAKPSSEYFCCGYAERVEFLGEHCYDLQSWVQEVRLEVLAGNSESRILNEDFETFLAKKWPQEAESKDDKG